MRFYGIAESRIDIQSRSGYTKMILLLVVPCTNCVDIKDQSRTVEALRGNTSNSKHKGHIGVSNSEYKLCLVVGQIWPGIDQSPVSRTGPSLASCCSLI
jgi:hypothetical protein